MAEAVAPVNCRVHGAVDGQLTEHVAANPPPTHLPWPKPRRLSTDLAARPPPHTLYSRSHGAPHTNSSNNNNINKNHNNDSTSNSRASASDLRPTSLQTQQYQHRSSCLTPGPPQNAKNPAISWVPVIQKESTAPCSKCQWLGASHPDPKSQ